MTDASVETLPLGAAGEAPHGASASSTPNSGQSVLSRFRDAGFVAKIAMLVAITMSVFHLWAGARGQPISEIFRPAHLGLALMVLFLGSPSKPLFGSLRAGQICNAIALALTIFGCGYLMLDAEAVQARIPYFSPPTTLQQLAGWGLVLALLEASRRVLGAAPVVVVVAFIAYAFWGNHLPYPFWHKGFTPERVLESAYLTQEGIWGTPIGVSAGYIFLFVLFGCFLNASGAGAFFTDFARALTGRAMGGPAKVAVVSSAFMGMLSGSPAANAATTGAFTIPAMRKAGYKGEFAAAVEAVASSGGQITPPILGAAAFIMAEFIGVPYVSIILVSIIPALLYFFAVYVVVDLEARRLQLRPGAEDVPPLMRILAQRGYLFISIGVMIWVLVEGFTPARAAVWAIASLAGMVLILDGANRRRFLDVCLEAMIEAPRMIGSVAVACALGGILVGVISQTGLGLRMSTIVLTLAGDSTLLLLALTMVMAIVLGMGMPTSGAYVILAALLAPALVKAGIPLIAAHLFILYCAGISTITPPVAIAAYAAAAVAGTSPWTTSTMAFRLGISSFIIPFMFVYGPPLLGDGTPLQVALSLATALLGIGAISASVVGWLRRPLPALVRALAVAGGLALVFPGWTTDLTGALCLLILAGYVLRAPKAAPAHG
ncbi:TRAP transporter permease [Salipiger sp. CCB-MM3]|uniref:TRAP transporter permease n=1 Tax=Salipiger sp. CCB-MM3 TaxID=1792508 RepID=UPI0009F5F50A|nr:TRAP transporter fused permease subunit [Salipiger sp. CCB-MM3]